MMQPDDILFWRDAPTDDLKLRLGECEPSELALVRLVASAMADEDSPHEEIGRYMRADRRALSQEFGRPVTAVDVRMLRSVLRLLRSTHRSDPVAEKEPCLG